MTAGPGTTGLPLSSMKFMPYIDASSCLKTSSSSISKTYRGRRSEEKALPTKPQWGCHRGNQGKNIDHLCANVNPVIFASRILYHMLTAINQTRSRKANN